MLHTCNHYRCAKAMLHGFSLQSLVVKSKEYAFKNMV